MFDYFSKVIGDFKDHPDKYFLFGSKYHSIERNIESGLRTQFIEMSKENG